nr:YqzH family protein [Neobacillus sp. Marseille-Q6967]
MDKKLVIKMIKNCFKQYYAEGETLPMSTDDLDRLGDRIIELKTEHPSIDLHELINDMVYEFLTG